MKKRPEKRSWGPLFSRFSSGILSLFLLLNPASPVGSEPPPSTSPALVVLILIDGLSYEQFEKHKTLFSEGGFKKLLAEGSSFSKARYDQLHTGSATDEATLITGAYPARHGIVGNAWMETRQTTGAVFDETVTVLGKKLPEGKKPNGPSPKQLLAPALGDLLIAKQPSSKVVSISLQDKTAVLTAARNGRAYFFDKETGQFMTSTYYAREYPAWWETFYASSPQNQWFLRNWELSAPEETYRNAAPDNRRQHVSRAGLGKKFPLLVTGGPRTFTPKYYEALQMTPFGNHYLLEFAHAALDGEALGQDAATDLLVLGFSSHALINRNYGPESRQSLDSLLRLDGLIAKFLEMLAQKVDPARTVVVLTSNQGYADSPEHSLDQGLEAGRLDTKAMLDELEKVYRYKYKTESRVAVWLNPFVYFSEHTIRSHKIYSKDAQKVARLFFTQHEGIAKAYSRSEWSALRPEKNVWYELIRRSCYKERCGELVLIPEKYWLLNDDKNVAAASGTLYDYDSHVPLVFWGAGIGPGEFKETVSMTSVAPTLASLLGLAASPSFDGKQLALGARK
ncbi:MAG: alkaline phosphatase family protein [Candidatus Omnitrophota bacterium]